MLEDGTKLATLRDAANVFAERFATVTSWRVLEIAIERLIAAAESAERDKVKAATDAIERVLRARRLLRANPDEPRILGTAVARCLRSRHLSITGYLTTIGVALAANVSSGISEMRGSPCGPLAIKPTCRTRTRGRADPRPPFLVWRRLRFRPHGLVHLAEGSRMRGEDSTGHTRHDGQGQCADAILPRAICSQRASSEHAKGVLRVIDLGKHHVGSTQRAAYQRVPPLPWKARASRFAWTASTG